MSSLRLAQFYPWQGIPDEFVQHPLKAFAGWESAEEILKIFFFTEQKKS